MRISRQFPQVGPFLLLLSISLPLCGCNQTSGYVMNESGKGYYAQGNYTAARREFERALMDSPENPNYAFNVASAMKKQGDLIGAERMYHRALTLDPRHQPAHHELAALLNDQGREQDAAAHIQEWVATQPYQPNAFVEQAWMQKQRGDLAGAEQSLRIALQQKPNHPAAIAQLGDVYQQTGRSQQAHAMYRRSLALNPFQPEVHARMSGRPGAPQAQPQFMAAYTPPIQMSSQAPLPMPGAVPVQQASYYQPQPFQMSPYPQQTIVSQQGMLPQRVAAPAAQFPVVQAGGIPQPFAADTAHPGMSQTMMQASWTSPIQQMQHTVVEPTSGLMNHTPQAYGPMTMSSVPIVTPF